MIGRFRLFSLAMLAGLSSSLAVNHALAQDVTDSINNTINQSITGSISDTVSNTITENVVYAKAKLRVSMPLLRFKQFAVAAGGNHLALRAEDGSIRVWNLQRGSQGRPITGAAANAVFVPSADGSRLLIGDAAGKVDIRDALTGKPNTALTGQGGQITQLMTSNDAQFLLIGYGSGAVEYWDMNKRGRLWQGHTGAAGVSALAMAPGDDKAAFGLVDGSLGSIDLKTGKAAPLGKTDKAVETMQFSADGKRVAAISASGQASLLTIGSKAGAAGGKLPIGDGVVAIADTLRVAAVAQGKAISVIDLASGQSAAQVTGDSDRVIGIQIDDKAQRLIAATADGKLIVWDLAAKKELLSIFISPTGWALVDRQGRFDGTADGLQNVSWEANKLNFPVTTLQQAFSDPGLLAAALKKSARAPRAVPQSMEKGLPLPPKIEIEPVPGDKVAGKPYQLIVIAEDQGGGIKDVRLYHNGKIVSVGAMLEQKDAENDGRHIRVVGYNVWPTPGTNVFQAVATGAYDNEGQKAEFRETFTGQAGAGVLNIIAVGVSKYPNLAPTDQLRVAASDAQAVASTVGGRAKPVFKSVQTRQLLDGQATRANILQALGGLKNTKPEDAILLFLSGHGFGNEDDWYFIPSDARFDDPKSWLKASEIRNALQAAGAQRVFVVVDSCYSGGTVDRFNAVTSFQTRFLDNGLRSAGVQVLTATRRDQMAPESVQLGYGFLTYVFLQGLQGAADKYPKDGVVTSQEVARYTYDTIPQVFLQQKERNPRAFAQAYGEAIQEPAIYSLGADLTLGAVGK